MIDTTKRANDRSAIGTFREGEELKMGGPLAVEDYQSGNGSGGADIDSLMQHPANGSDGYNMSDIEEDKKYMDEVQKGIEYESEGSRESDIPEEHENGYGYNEYMRRYVLNMKTMTWNRDSQGLFDYETRHCSKQKLKTDKSS